MNKDCDEFDMWAKNRLTKNDIYKAIFEGMTNGEVIQALFPNGKVIECDEATGYEQMLDDKYSYCSWFDGLWWNSPYKGEEDDNEMSEVRK